MTCDECRLRLIAKPESAWEVAAVAVHLGACPHCEEFLFRMVRACQQRERPDGQLPIDREIVRLLKIRDERRPE